MQSVKLAVASLPVVSLMTLARAEPPESPSYAAMTQDQAPKTEPAPGPPYPPHLARDLRRLSCFDTPIGDKMGGIVPIGPVGDSEKAALQAAWMKVLVPASLPRDPTAIDCRVVQWSLVEWIEPSPQQARRSKSPGPPPKNDVCFARWLVGGTPLVVSGALHPNGVHALTVTLRLAGEDRLRFRWPHLAESPSPPSSWAVVKDVDKARLFTILQATLPVPWKSIDEFEVTWNPSPFPPGAHIRIGSARRQERAWPEPWFDLIVFGVEGVDPQQISFGIALPASDTGR